MHFIEILLLSGLIAAGAFASLTDLKSGMIRNKMLSVFGILALVLDLIYYGLFATDLLTSFLGNSLLIAVICLFLFYSQILAGGDVKLAILLAGFYPAQYLIRYGKTDLTLYFSLGIAVLLGFFYLLITSLVSWGTRRSTITVQDFVLTIIQYLKRYLFISVYFYLINLMLYYFVPSLMHRYPVLINLGLIMFAFQIQKIKLLRNKYVLLAVILLDLTGCILTGLMPFSVNPSSYLFIFLVLSSQLVISKNLYQKVSRENLKAGMIPSLLFSMKYQKSRFKNLPGISAENLGSRLSEEQANAVVRWMTKNKIEEAEVVKKIPFGVFIFAGYLIYFGIWRFIS